MTLKSNQLVDVPEHTVFSQKDGKKYVYLITKSFRNNKGQPDNKRISIGKLDVATGKLIPNMNYYEYFGKEKPEKLPNTIRSCGSYAVCRNLSESLGLTSILRDVFPENYREILTVAHYMLTTGSVMYYLEDWLDRSISFSPDNLNDIAIGRVFKELDEEKRNRFFRKWMKKRAAKEFIAYDVTSISSYAKSLDNVEYGYNRDKEKLPQINYGMYYGEESRLPFYYRIYPGSINDKTHCEYMIEGTDWLDFSKAYFVMDKGFFTEANLKALTEKGHRFLITMPPTLKIYRELIQKNKDDIINNVDYRIPGHLLYGKKTEITPYGFRINAHIFYNQEKAADNAAAFYTKLEAMENDIAKMIALPPSGSVYYDYYDLTLKGNTKSSYVLASRKKDAVKAALDRCGFFIICETAFNKSTEEVLSIYSERDTIEKCFDDLKNELDLARLRCSRNQTAEGKMFTAFLSLILLSQLRKSLHDFMTQQKLTFKKVLLELDKIKVVYDSSKPDKYRLLNPLTKKQRLILDQLNMAETVFEKLL